MREAAMICAAAALISAEAVSTLNRHFDLTSASSVRAVTVSGISLRSRAS